MSAPMPEIELPPSEDFSQTSAPRPDPVHVASSPPPRVPSLRSISDPPTTTPSSTPLGPVNAARRGPPTPSKPFANGTMSKDIQARLQAFQASRAGAAPNSAVGTPKMPSPIQPNRIAVRPMPPPNWNSAPAIPGSKKPSLGQRRGLKLPGGLPGGASPMSPKNTESPFPGNGANGTDTTPKSASSDQGSMFDQYSQYVDTQTGSLKFAGKAVLHGKGIEFSTGSSFSMSLDEIEQLDELGKGNYGTVYKVLHKGPMRKQRASNVGMNGLVPPGSLEQKSKGVVEMAMKEIRLELDENKFAQIIMELDVLHRCRSPYIIDFYGAFFQEGAVYICMEFMDGGSIDKLYQDGVPEGVLRKITFATVMGLKTLKDDHNIIHRDVKPTNILVNSRGDIKMCDFGVSGNLVASIAKTNIGCQSYMAPERIASGGPQATIGGQPGGTYGVQSDIWSLGLSILECAMGCYPYPPETYNNIFSQLSAIVDGEPPDLPEDRFSPQSRDFVHKCLHKVPKLRPSYAQLLRHPWIADLSKPQTITEDAEAEENAENDAAIDVPSVEDAEVREWVVGAMAKRKARIEEGIKGPQKPALHAVQLDTVSPSVERKAENAEVDEVAKGVEELKTQE